MPYCDFFTESPSIDLEDTGHGQTLTQKFSVHLFKIWNNPLGTAHTNVLVYVCMHAFMNSCMIYLRFDLNLSNKEKTERNLLQYIPSSQRYGGGGGSSRLERLMMWSDKIYA